MNDYLFLMHAGTQAEPEDWAIYIAKLRAAGCFQGGSSIGSGICATKSGAAPAPTRHLAGYMKIRATDLNHATALLEGNPVFEGGGVVEVRELPKD